MYCVSALTCSRGGGNDVHNLFLWYGWGELLRDLRHEFELLVRGCGGGWAHTLDEVHLAVGQALALTGLNHVYNNFNYHLNHFKINSGTVTN